MSNTFEKFLENRYIAHRGNWTRGIPENSIEAFRRAVECGYAIELDIHLLEDKEIAVFHDYTLKRMCRRSIKLSSLTSDMLGRYKLKGTKYTIPLIDDVLKIVNGKVPLYIEIKSTSRYIELVNILIDKLKNYSGLVAFLSFDYRPLKYIKEKFNYPVALSQMVVSNKMKFEPDGICANINFLNKTKLRGNYTIISWTVNNHYQLTKANRLSDMYIINTKRII